MYVREEVEAQIKRGRNEDGRSRAGRSCLKWADARADGKSDFAPGKSRREERRWTWEGRSFGCVWISIWSVVGWKIVSATPGLSRENYDGERQQYCVKLARQHLRFNEQVDTAADSCLVIISSSLCLADKIRPDLISTCCKRPSSTNQERRLQPFVPALTALAPFSNLPAQDVLFSRAPTQSTQIPPFDFHTTHFTSTHLSQQDTSEHRSPDPHGARLLMQVQSQARTPIL